MSSKREWNLDWPPTRIVCRRGCAQILEEYGAIELQTTEMSKTKRKNAGRNSGGQEH